MDDFYLDHGIDKKHIEIWDCDYIQTGPAPVAEISPTRKRVGSVDRAGNAVFFRHVIDCGGLAFHSDNCACLRWRAN